MSNKNGCNPKRGSQALALIAALLLPLALAAENANGPRMVRVFTITLEPGAMRDYTEGVKRVAEAHRKIDSKRWWTTTTSEFGDLNQITFVRWYDNPGAMDEPPLDAVAEAFGEEEAKALRARGRELVQHAHSGLWFQRRDLSNPWPEDPARRPKYLILFQVTIAPGANGRFEAYLAKSLEATKAQAPNAHYMAYSPGFGAENVYTFVSLLDNLADLGPQMPIPERILNHFGKREGGKLLEERAAVVTAQSVVMDRTRPDLGYFPQQN